MAQIIEFNFTPEQQKRFNEIYEETKKIYPQHFINVPSKERIKVLIAYSVINGDLPLKKDEIVEKVFDNVFNEIKD